MKLMIAGGGTGGHLYCGLAIAEEWKSRGGEVVFVGTKKGMEVKLVPEYGYPLELVKVSSLKGRGLGARIKTLLGLPLSLIQSFVLLKRHKPQVVIGIGGYASGPAVIAAKIMRLKTAVIDQNSIPGMTNRILGKWTDLVFLTFEISKKYFRHKRLKVYGNPVLRKRIPTDVPDVSQKELRLLICGGSQGAHAINENVLGAAKEIVANFPSIRVVHQTGEADKIRVMTELRNKDVMASVLSFIPDMDAKYREAKLVISRSGAGTLTELALWGLPSILIPYPHAADNHQYLNAKVFEEAGAAIILNQDELTGKKIADAVKEVFSSAEKMKSMSDAAKSLGRPHAAIEVVDDLIRLIV